MAREFVPVAANVLWPTTAPPRLFITVTRTFSLTKTLTADLKGVAGILHYHRSHHHNHHCRHVPLTTPLLLALYLAHSRHSLGRAREGGKEGLSGCRASERRVSEAEECVRLVKDGWRPRIPFPALWLYAGHSRSMVLRSVVCLVTSFSYINHLYR